jgi:NAD(P)-dependent dehydrogenase (short-subunit alcohol dehydrogenase family)
MSDTLPRFDGKVALVTGASRGIGRAIAKALALQGAHVIALARTKGGLEELDDELKALGANISLVRLDLREGAQIDNVGPSLYERWQRLDIFVGNAGILGPLSPLGHISEADWTQTLNINVTANWRLLRTLDPILRLSAAGRVLFMTSNAAQNCRAYWGPYSVSKAGLEALAKTYAHEVQSTAVRVNLLNPGRIRTRMRAKAYPGEDGNTVPPPEAVVPLALSLLTEETTANGECFDFVPEGQGR